MIVGMREKLVLEFEGQVALISGGGSGIGAAIAEQLARRGASVAVTDVDVSSAEAIAEAISASGGSAMALPLDVRFPEQWANVTSRVKQEFGAVDFLCSNAGVVGSMKSIVEQSPEYFQWLMDVNLMGTIHGIQATVPDMICRRRGTVLITSSIGGVSVAPLLADYCASKHALVAVADSLRAEVQNTGVKVALLCPSAVATGLSRNTQREVPAELAGHLAVATSAAQSAVKKSKSASGGALSSDAVAAIAIDGLLDGRFFIFTHPETSRRVAARDTEMQAGFAAIGRGNEARQPRAEDR